MNYHKIIIATFATALLGGLSAVSAAPETAGTSGKAAASTTTSRTATVLFIDNSQSFQSQIVNGTIMISGRNMLGSIGYSVNWDAAAGTLAATRPGKPTIVFKVGSHDVELGGKKAAGLPVAPYISGGSLWVPLRWTAGATGLNVIWDTANRYAFVSDPLALPKITLTTRADNRVTDQTSNLNAYFKSQMKLDVSLNLIQPDNYREKSIVLIAAGDTGSVLLLQNSYTFPDELLQSFAVDLTEDLNAYPRLKKLATEAPGGRMVGERIYGIPRPRDLHNAPFPAIRQDWLDVLGLAQPQTLDELYTVLKQFKDKDPDGNGKEDTYGLTGSITAASLGSFAWVEQAFTGSPERFSVHNGHVVDHAVGAEEVKALQWLARAYKDGLIDKEFAILSPEQATERIRENRVGAATLSLRETAALTDDKMKWIPLPGLKADVNSVPIAPWNTDVTDTYIISRMSRVAPKTILQWLDNGMAMNESKAWDGIEGLDESDRAAIRSIFGEPDLLSSDVLKSLPEQTRGAYETAITEWHKTSYADSVVPAFSKLWSTGKYSDMNTRLTQMQVKFIMGTISVENWEQYTKALTASKEYKAMIAELATIKG